MEYIQQNFSTHKDLVLQSRLNVRLPPSTPESFLKTIYQIRYRAIRDSQLAQSKIVKKIETVRREILGHGRKPDGFTAAFRALLVEQAYTVGYTENEDPKAKTLHKINRQRMEKLYNFSPTDYEEHRIAPSYKSRYLKTKAELSEKHLQKIHAVVSTVLEEMKKVRKDERIQRGLLTKELRHARHWSKETLAEKIKELFPESTLTASRIKTIEKDQAEVSNSEAQELQHVFDERIQSGSVVQEIRLANGWSKETLVEKIKGLFLRSAFTTLTIKKIEKSKKLISSSAAKALRQIFGEEVQNDLTIEELRNAKGWSQKELVEKIKELFLDSDLDASTIDKLEKSQEPIPRAVEKELHQAFNLSLELFIPHFFYE
jgi:transcriptional regulator with XRE-family HTH domain